MDTNIVVTGIANIDHFYGIYIIGEINPACMKSLSEIEQVEMPCGSTLPGEQIRARIDEDIPCLCGDPSHWFLKHGDA